MDGQDLLTSSQVEQGAAGGLTKVAVSFTQIEVQGEVKFKCDACGKIFDKEPGMKNHITTEKRERDKEENDEQGSQ